MRWEVLVCFGFIWCAVGVLEVHTSSPVLTLGASCLYETGDGKVGIIGSVIVGNNSRYE